ncbi:MAG: N-acetylmuramoyl-L-alanine amidase, partial [Oscillospiraceae bacterium]
ISVENNGKTTDISFNLKYKTPPIINLTGLSFTENYTIKNFNPEYMVVDMPYVNATNGINFKENPLFSNASISQITEKGVVKTRISFKFKNGKSFSGASSYFDSNGKLIISVRNPMKSLSGVRVVLSQGHGGSDTGANGFNGINEVDLNRSMTEKVSKYLKDEGGEVIVISPNVGDST